MNKKYKRVAFDIDNTLTVLQPTLDLMAETFGCLPYSEDDITSFRLSDAYNITREEELDFWQTKEEQICSQSVFALNRISNILETYTEEDCEFLYVTARDKAYTEATISWLVSVGLPAGKILLLGKESKMAAIQEFGAEAVFEDNPDFFEEWERKQLKDKFDAYCIHYPYNASSPATEHICRHTGLPLSDSLKSEFEDVLVPKSFFYGLEATKGD